MSGQKSSPVYDGKSKCWYLKTEHGREVGDALYIAGEYARAGVIYPFHSEPPEHEEHYEHVHCFEGVVEYVMSAPSFFSIDGFDEYYSVQEQNMLQKLWEKISE